MNIGFWMLDVGHENWIPIEKITYFWSLLGTTRETTKNIVVSRRANILNGNTLD